MQQGHWYLKHFSPPQKTKLQKAGEREISCPPVSNRSVTQKVNEAPELSSQNQGVPVANDPEPEAGNTVRSKEAEPALSEKAKQEGTELAQGPGFQSTLPVVNLFGHELRSKVTDNSEGYDSYSSSGYYSYGGSGYHNYGEGYEYDELEGVDVEYL